MAGSQWCPCNPSQSGKEWDKKAGAVLEAILKEAGIFMLFYGFNIF